MSQTFVVRIFITCQHFWGIFKCKTFSLSFTTETRLNVTRASGHSVSGEEMFYVDSKIKERSAVLLLALCRIMDAIPTKWNQIKIEC